MKSEAEHSHKPTATSRGGADTMVPHVTIHCFADHAEERGAFDAFAGDRRLRHATIDVDAGSLEAASSRYESSPSPHLIIVATDAESDTLLDGLNRLADRCEPGTKVIIVGRSNDISLYRDLMDRGISEYFVAPVDPRHLAAAAVRLFCGDGAPRLGKLFAFIGAKGGAGNSTVAQNVAWALSKQRGADVLLADMDLAFGTLALGCDVPAGKGMADVVRETGRLDDALLERLMTRRDKHLRLLTAPERPGDAPPVDVETMRTFLDVAQRAMPTVVLDLPHHWSDWIRLIIEEADQVVITSIPTLSGIRNAASAMATVKEIRPDRNDPLFVLTQRDMPRRHEISPREMQTSLGLSANFTIGFNARLFGAAESQGTMLADTGKSRIARDFAAIAERLGGRTTPAPRSLFDRIMRR